MTAHAPHCSLPPFFGRIIGTLLDPTILFSFDRTGYLIHSSEFVAGDLDADMSGKVCVVTGANSGIGFEAARGLARRGADVWLLCRNRQRGEAAVETIRGDAGSARSRLEVVDMASLRSIRAFAERFAASQVHVLVNNAGVLPEARHETEDGLELTWATNVVGPFLLTHLLLPKLEAARGARVINVSSGGMYAQKLSLDDVEFRRAPFDGTTAYALTKRAEVVLTELWAERMAARLVTFNSMHPGWADTPAVRTSLPRFHRVMKNRLRTPEQGADTVIWLAVCPRIASTTGLFWLDRTPRSTHYLPWTRESPEDRQRLWALCCRQAGINELRPNDPTSP